MIFDDCKSDLYILILHNLCNIVKYVDHMGHMTTDHGHILPYSFDVSQVFLFAAITKMSSTLRNLNGERKNKLKISIIKFNVT